MKILLIEDEKYCFENLCCILKQIEPEVEIVGPVSNIVDMYDHLQRQEDYDIIFSDIKLEDGICFEAFADIPELKTPIIFLTAYDKYAIDAFKIGGLAYILKPIDKEELISGINRAYKMKLGTQNMDLILQSYGLASKKQYMSRLLVRNFDGLSVLPVEDISYIVFESGKNNVYTKNGSCFALMDRTLDSVYNRLNPGIFFRANRQYIVHIDAINKIHWSFRQTANLELKLFKNLRINLSKLKVSELQKWIESM
ncbi:MAG: LytTR family DNA-binding domain-containing protein [Bacteroidales bacterium]|nr:LytTR family DNA-binding domain-containing protein [Bacteroidales bacterium]